MGSTVNAYRRLPEHTTTPDEAWEIDNLVEDIARLSVELESKKKILLDTLAEYHAYLRRHWTQEEILASQKSEGRE